MEFSSREEASPIWNMCSGDWWSTVAADGNRERLSLVRLVTVTCKVFRSGGGVGAAAAWAALVCAAGAGFCARRPCTAVSAATAVTPRGDDEFLAAHGVSPVALVAAGRFVAELDVVAEAHTGTGETSTVRCGRSGVHALSAGRSSVAPSGSNTVSVTFHPSVAIRALPNMYGFGHRQRRCRRRAPSTPSGRTVSGRADGALRHRDPQWRAVTAPSDH